MTVDESIAKSQASAIGRYVDNWRDRAMQGIGIPGDADTVSYILLGLAAERYPADAGTDAMAYFLRHSQVPDGSWRTLAHRPPIEVEPMQVTAMAMRALQVYAPAAQREAYRPTIDKAAAWIAKAPAQSSEARAFKLLGLHWSNAGGAAIQKAAKAILARAAPRRRLVAAADAAERRLRDRPGARRARRRAARSPPPTPPTSAACSSC